MLSSVTITAFRIVTTTPTRNMVPKLIRPEANAEPDAAPPQGKDTARAVPAMMRARMAPLYPTSCAIGYSSVEIIDVVAVPLVRWLMIGVAVAANHGKTAADTPPDALMIPPSQSVMPRRASPAASAVPLTT